MLRCRSSATLTRKSTPTLRWTSSSASCSGLPSTMPGPMRPSSMAGPWATRTVSTAARPGHTALRPPEYPAIRCGSIKPVMIRRSLSRKPRSIRIGMPPAVRPRSRWAAASRASCCTIRSVRAISGPSMASSSAGVFGRCRSRLRPRIVTALRRQAAGAQRVEDRRQQQRRWGPGRVMSDTTITASRRPRAISRRGGAAVGCSRDRCSSPPSDRRWRGRGASRARRPGGRSGIGTSISR